MKRLLLALILLPTLASFAQNKIYNVEDLSSFSYKILSDTIGKNWVCPKTYPDKNTQSDFCKEWTNRTLFLQQSVKDNDFLRQPQITAFVDEIITELFEKNKKLLNTKPQILIDRSSIVNAYSLGKNIIVINMGLISFCKYKEELALVIAHEMGHNFLEHSYTSMCKKAEWLNSKEYKDFIKDVTNDKYGRLTKIVNTYKEFTYNRNKHNRFGEHSADSMAIIFLKNTKFGFDANYFLRLDSSDLEYKHALAKPPAEYFNALQIQTKPEWFLKKGRGLSTKTYNFDEKSTINDTLKTHPECKERYNITKSETTPNAPKTPIPMQLKLVANKSIIWNLYRLGSFTDALYRIFLLTDDGQRDYWTDFMFTNIIISLYNEDAMLNRSNVIRIKPKEYIGREYYALQTMLEQVTTDDLAILKNNAMQYPISNMGAEESAFKGVLKSISLNPEEYKYSKKEKKKEYAGKLLKTIYFDYFD